MVNDIFPETHKKVCQQNVNVAEFFQLFLNLEIQTTVETPADSFTATNLFPIIGKKFHQHISNFLLGRI